MGLAELCTLTDCLLITKGAGSVRPSNSLLNEKNDLLVHCSCPRRTSQMPLYNIVHLDEFRDGRIQPVPVSTS